MTGLAEHLRAQIMDLVRAYYAEAFPVRVFVPGETPIPVSGRVFDSDEITHLVESSLDCWLTMGRFAEEFEQRFSRFLGVRHAVLCNSGSSANLLALSALTSSKLGGEALKPGDEVITIAAGFPTTVNPIIQNRLVPVFLDIQMPTYDIDVRDLERAVGPRTGAIMVAHTLGNPFNVEAVLEVTRQHDLWLIEDNCDGLGSLYQGKMTGTFGDLATVSFYPAHHITMGEGGCVVTNQTSLKTLVESFRDWGRDCWCDPGKENTCGRRFAWQLGDLPSGYDHKYIYSHIGYNLKLTDMQAAVGVAQLQKLPDFIRVRKRNWQLLREGLKPYEDVLILPEPTPQSDPSWFGFLITVHKEAPFTRADLIRHLDERKIGTRLLFGGNLTSQSPYREVPYRVVGPLANTDLVMRQAFWIGVYPGLTEEMIGYMIETIGKFVRSVPSCAAKSG